MDPCCEITAIDARTGLVAASDAHTRGSFDFLVTEPMLLRSLNVGQKVYADFTIEAAGVAPDSFCCAIVRADAVLLRTRAPPSGRLDEPIGTSPRGLTLVTRTKEMTS